MIAFENTLLFFDSVTSSILFFEPGWLGDGNTGVYNNICYVDGGLTFSTTKSKNGYGVSFLSGFSSFICFYKSSKYYCNFWNYEFTFSMTVNVISFFCLSISNFTFSSEIPALYEFDGAPAEAPAGANRPVFSPFDILSTNYLFYFDNFPTLSFANEISTLNFEFNSYYSPNFVSSNFI